MQPPGPLTAEIKLAAGVAACGWYHLSVVHP